MNMNMNYFASDDWGNSSFSHGQTDTDTVGCSTGSGTSQGHTAHAPMSDPKVSATSLGPSLKRIRKEIHLMLKRHFTKEIIK